MTPKVTAGGQSVAVNEIQAEHITPLVIRQNARPAQGFRYAEEDFSPVFEVERRKPYIEVGQLIVADVEQGEVEFRVGLHYHVRYSGVKTFGLTFRKRSKSLSGMIHPVSLQELKLIPLPKILLKATWRGN